MPSADEVKSFLKERLAPQLAKAGISEPTDDLSLTESGLIDSFGLLEIVMAIQEKFGIEVDVSDVDPDVFTTYGGLANTIASKN